MSLSPERRYNVTYAHAHSGTHPDDYKGRSSSDPAPYSMRSRSWTDNVVHANWIISRRGKFFGPPDEEHAQSKETDELQTNVVGHLQIGGHGTYNRHHHYEKWESYDPYPAREYSHTDKDGHAHYKWVTKYHWMWHWSTTDPHKTQVIDFSYKMNVCASTCLDLATSGLPHLALPCIALPCPPARCS